jgi:hypothetical protein
MRRHQASDLRRAWQSYHGQDKHTTGLIVIDGWMQPLVEYDTQSVATVVISPKEREGGIKIKRDRVDDLIGKDNARLTITPTY